MTHLYNVVLYHPLYNAFIGIISTFPWLDAGLVVIIFTVIVKLILFPLSQRAVRSQIQIKNIQPEIDALKLKLASDKQAQALAVMNLYKEKKINPFSGVILTLIQLPVLLALYAVFYRGGLDVIHVENLYSFIKAPTEINKMFLGLIDITHKSTIMSLVVALGQYLQIRFTLPKTEKKIKTDETKTSFQDELSKNMNLQMRYILPVIMFVVARSFPVLVSLYLITSSLFAIGQEVYMRKKITKE